MTNQKPLVDDNIKERRLLFAKLCESARIVSELSREQLSDKTKVPLSFIEAIENGSKDLDISSVYTRGFIRLLCKTWGTDEEDYLAAFQLAYPKDNGAAKASIEAISEIQKSTGQQSLLSKEGKSGLMKHVGNGVKSAVSRASDKMKTSQTDKSGSTPEPRYRKVLPVVAGIMVVLGFTIFQDTWNSSEQAPMEPSVAVSKQITNKRENVPLEDVASEPQKSENLVAEPSGQTEPVSKPLVEALEASEITKEIHADASSLPESSESALTEDRVYAEHGPSTVTVSAMEEVLVKITKDKESRRNIQMQAGTDMEFSFEDLLQLLIMDASKVKISFNGIDLGNLGGAGRVRRISFSNTEIAAKRL